MKGHAGRRIHKNAVFLWFGGLLLIQGFGFPLTVCQLSFPQNVAAKLSTKCGSKAFHKLWQFSFSFEMPGAKVTVAKFSTKDFGKL